MALKNIIKFKKIFLILPIILACIISLQLSYTNIVIPASSEVVNWDNWNIETKNNSYIKWVDFTPTYDVLNETSKLDINSHINNENIKFNWI